MEKRGEVRPGWTPPEHEGQKTAGELEDCVGRRAEQAAVDQRRQDQQDKDRRQD